SIIAVRKQIHPDKGRAKAHVPSKEIYKLLRNTTFFHRSNEAKASLFNPAHSANPDPLQNLF
ncbi:MAG: hypothetical protein ACR2IL_01875, partial [Chitinophagaceae bacterium]